MIRRLLVLLLLALAAPAAADELRPGFIEFVQQDAHEWSLNWKQPLAAPGPAPLVVPVLPQGCAIEDAPVKRSLPTSILGSAKVTCADKVAGGTMGLDAILGGGDVMLRVAPLDRPVQTFRLTAAGPMATIAPKPAIGQVWRSYFLLGVEHILAGWDHLLFVIALVLLVRRGWAVAKAVTAFTVAHSLTLAGVSLGFLGLPGRPVEAVIALSIVLLAVEVARGDRPSLTRRWPWVVAFLFGLIHGFGFAGALREIGLPEGEVPAALISFNLGVEAGQLCVVLGVLLVLEAIRRLRAKALAPAIRVASYGIGITGSYWLVERIVG